MRSEQIGHRGTYGLLLRWCLGRLPNKLMLALEVQANVGDCHIQPRIARCGPGEQATGFTRLRRANQMNFSTKFRVRSLVIAGVVLVVTYVEG